MVWKELCRRQGDGERNMGVYHNHLLFSDPAQNHRWLLGFQRDTARSTHGKISTYAALPKGSYNYDCWIRLLASDNEECA